MTGGSALTWEHAIAKAIGEAVERHSVLEWDPPVRVASASELDADIDIDSYDLFHSDQRAARNFPFQRLDRDSRIGWVRAYSLTFNRETFLPATLANLYYEPRTSADSFDLCPVSGYACGNTLEEALLGALCEVVERDALMISWYQRLPVPSLDLASLVSKTVREALSRFAHAPVRLYCADLTTDLEIPSVLVMMTSTHPGWPAAAVATAADSSYERAVLKALSELSRGRALALSYSSAGRSLPRSPRDVRCPEDHGLYYAAPQALEHLDLLLRPRKTVNVPAIAREEVETDIKTELDTCVRKLASCGLEVLAVEIGSQAIADQGLHVAKVVVPGMLPIDFGGSVPHHGGTRLYSAPKKMGYPLVGSRPADLNRMPHPLP